MSYEQFAYLYDRLMENVPYERWMAFLTDQLEKREIEGRRILDLACGTGTISTMLAEKGYDVTGVDLSDDMLAVARKKSLDTRLDIAFFQQDMRELEGLHDFDVVVIFLDSLNYLEEEKDYLTVFQKVYEVLKPGGVLLFDVHTPYKINEVFLGATFAENGEDLSFIWECFPGEFPDSVEHDLSFFKRNPDGELYRRFDEWHVQRTFKSESFVSWLKEAGFTSIDQLPEKEGESLDTTERWFFAATK